MTNNSSQQKSPSYVEEQKRYNELERQRIKEAMRRSQVRGRGDDKYTGTGRKAAQTYVQATQLAKRNKKLAQAGMKDLRNKKEAIKREVKKKVIKTLKFTRLLPLLPIILIFLIFSLLFVGVLLGAFVALCPDSTSFFDRLLSSQGELVSFCNANPL